MMLAAVLLQAALGQTVATCRVPSDPHLRAWSLERRTESGASPSWLVVFSARSLDKPRVELPLANAQPVITASEVRLSFASANGGRTIEWRITNGPSTLDLGVNHGLEVNVERDLDPAVDLMNTDGPLSLTCSMNAGSPSTPLRTGREPGALRLRSGQAGNREWMIAAGVARSVKLFESAAGRAYAVQTIGWSRELTRELKLIGIRGRFAWAVEATPLFAQFSPSSIYGIGFAPVVWRWNFVPRPRWSAFGELAMGGLFTSDPIPDKTSRANFSAHWGGGIRLMPRGRNALLLAYRFQHFSNGNQIGSNPGVNSHVVLIGWSHRS